MSVVELEIKIIDSEKTLASIVSSIGPVVITLNSASWFYLYVLTKNILKSIIHLLTKAYKLDCKEFGPNQPLFLFINHNTWR